MVKLKKIHGIIEHNFYMTDKISATERINFLLMSRACFGNQISGIKKVTLP